MTVKQLIAQLQKLVDTDPKNADLEVRWYTGAGGKLDGGDGWPVKLFKHIYTKSVYCVLNAVANPPAFGLRPFSGKKQENDSEDKQ